MASMNVSLPDPMRAWVQERIDSGRYASVSDYVRDLTQAGCYEDRVNFLTPRTSMKPGWTL